jgi:methionyl-tRNA formyltransferase
LIDDRRSSAQQRLRLGFAGTPEFAATILRALLASNHELALVLTQPDRPTGRGRKLKPSPVKVLALTHQLTLRDPATLKNASLTDDHLDLLIVAAYGLILPDHILRAPRLGCLNVHASLLPRWRGAAPVERAMIAGDSEIGVCLMQMDSGLDTGSVYDCERLIISATETGGQLEDRLASAGAQLLVASLPRIEGMIPSPQPEEGITYAHKITARDNQIDWGDSAQSIVRRIQALADRQPVTVFSTGRDSAATRGDSVRIRLLSAVIGAAGSSGSTDPDSTITPPGTIIGIDREGLEVACGQGRAHIRMLQLNRGKGVPMAASQAANGYPDILGPGAVLLDRLPS